MCVCTRTRAVRVWGVSDATAKWCLLLPAMAVTAVQMAPEVTGCLELSLNKFWLLCYAKKRGVARPLGSLP